MGACLLKGGAHVSFFARGETLRALRSRGIRIEDDPDVVTFEHVEVTDDIAEIGPVDVVVFGVKAWQLDDALRIAAPLLGPQTLALVPQNGVEPPLQVAGIVGKERAVVGLVRISCVTVEPGWVRRQGGELIEIGTLAETPHRARIEELCRILGPRATIPADIFTRMWDKMIIMATMTAVGMVTRTPISVLADMPELLDLVVRVGAEAVAVARAHGASLNVEDYGESRFKATGRSSASMSSTQRDFMHGRPSDLDAVVGAVPRIGRTLEIPTPIFDILHAALMPQELKARGALLYECT